jgi:hypothetical protein
VLGYSSGPLLVARTPPVDAGRLPGKAHSREADLRRLSAAENRPTCSSAPRRSRGGGQGRVARGHPPSRRSLGVGQRQGPRLRDGRAADDRPAGLPAMGGRDSRSGLCRRPGAAPGEILDAEVVVRGASRHRCATRSADRRGAGLAGFHDARTSLRPGLVEHAGGLHRDLGSAIAVPLAVPGARWRWSSRTSTWLAETRTTSSSWPSSTTSSRTGTPTRRTADHIRELLATDRLEFVGGTYNEPNTT